MATAAKRTKSILVQTTTHVRQLMSGEGTGHDWWHVQRVVNNARAIQKQEGGDKFIIELTALLHDIGDWKFHGGDTTVGPRMAREWLTSLDVDTETTDHVAYIIEHMSFRGGTNQHKLKTLEGQIVQDADRLDALGAIGIARAFAYGGANGRPLHDPDQPQATPHQTFEQYQNFKASSINHFYEKLLHVRDRLNTKTAKAMAEHRHKYLEDYLEEFYAEWDGKL